MINKRVTLFDAVLLTILCIVTALFLMPVIITVSTAISSTKALGSKPVYLLPYGFSLEALKLVLSNPVIYRYYGNTVLYAFVGCVIMLAVTSLAAYPLSIPGFQGKRIISILYTITMFFGGGLIPSYLNIRQLGMMDTIWVMVIPSAVSAYNVFVFKTFFLGIPSSLSESAFLDGAGHFRVVRSIILPLSKALLATFALFYIVGKWNDYLTSVIYLSGQKQTIQSFLRSILVDMKMDILRDDAKRLETLQTVSERTIRSAAVVATITPILCIYPLLQKYFAQGVLVGSIKA